MPRLLLAGAPLPLIRELNIPQTVTKVEGWCGLACIRAILAYYGLRVTDAKLSARGGKKAGHGYTLPELQGVAQTFGIEPWYLERIDVKHMPDALDDGHPILSYIALPGAGHAVVVTGVDEREIVFMDPRGWRTVLSHADWNLLRRRADRPEEGLVFPAGLMFTRKIPKRVRRSA